MNLYDEFFKIAESLEENKIQYAVIGGIALAFYDKPRFTRDIDIIILPEEAERIKKVLDALGYFETSEPRTFKNANISLHRFMKRDEEDYLVVDVLVGHEERHRRIILYAKEEKSEKGSIKIARKKDLIWLKKIRNSDQDRVDIKRLENDKD